MRWKPVRLIPDNTKYPFMRWSRFGFFLSGILCTASIIIFATVGLRYGIDFKGGSVLTIRTEQPAELDKLRSTLSALALGVVELQQYGRPSDLQIRSESQSGGDATEQSAMKKGTEA